jgi:hypothetical protein
MKYAAEIYSTITNLPMRRSTATTREAAEIKVEETRQLFAESESDALGVRLVEVNGGGVPHVEQKPTEPERRQGYRSKVE